MRLVMTTIIDAIRGNAPRSPFVLVALVMAIASWPTARGASAGADADGAKRLGEKTVPADAYYRVQTARVLENFQLPIPINHYPGSVEALASRTNRTP